MVEFQIRLLMSIFCITHEGFTGTKARAQLQRIALSAHCQGEPNLSDMDDTALFMNTGKPPELIKYFKRGKYFELTEGLGHDSRY